MPRGRKTSLTIRLTPTERATLRAWQRSSTIRAGLARRGRIILLIAEGMSLSAIAATVGISRRFVYKWAQRFLQYGVEGLADQPGRGCHRRASLPATATSDEHRGYRAYQPSEDGRR
jgi:DNA-binding CsgD family transcriptional regulator